MLVTFSYKKCDTLTFSQRAARTETKTMERNEKTRKMTEKKDNPPLDSRTDKKKKLQLFLEAALEKFKKTTTLTLDRTKKKKFSNGKSKIGLLPTDN